MPQPGKAVSRVRAAAVVHPFPSILDGAAVAAIATVAGASPATAAVAALAMTGIQFGIGATNDVLDLERDRLVQPSKPIPAALLTRRSAQMIALGTATAGLGLSALLGAPVFLAAAAGLAVGLAYDAWLQRTPLAWLPYATGLPLLVVFAWQAGSGTLFPALPSLILLGFLAGLAIALANGLVDPEADASTQGRGLTTWLGRRPALAGLATVDAALLLAVWVGLASGPDGGPPPVAALRPLAPFTWAGGVVATLGSAALVGGWLGSSRASRHWRELGWESQAVGIALLGTAWLGAVAR